MGSLLSGAQGRKAANGGLNPPPLQGKGAASSMAYRSSLALRPGAVQCCGSFSIRRSCREPRGLMPMKVRLFSMEHLLVPHLAPLLKARPEFTGGTACNVAAAQRPRSG